MRKRRNSLLGFFTANIKKILRSDGKKCDNEFSKIGLVSPALQVGGLCFVTRQNNCSSCLNSGPSLSAMTG